MNLKKTLGSSLLALTMGAAPLLAHAAAEPAQKAPAPVERKVEQRKVEKASKAAKKGEHHPMKKGAAEKKGETKAAPAEKTPATTAAPASAPAAPAK